MVFDRVPHGGGNCARWVSLMSMSSSTCSYFASLKIFPDFELAVEAQKTPTNQLLSAAAEERRLLPGWRFDGAPRLLSFFL